MRGLLIKDMRFILRNKKIVIVLLGVAMFALFMMENENTSFIIGYMTMVCGMLVWNTISMDEYDKSSAFLMTLPIDRDMYAKEKYVVAFGCSLAGWLIATALCVFLRINHVKEILIQAVAILLILSLVQLVMLPVQLKYGGEKGRMVVIGMVLFVCASIIGIGKIGEILFIDTESVYISIINWLSSLHVWVFVIAGCILWGLCFVISLTVSERIMRKKEF